MAKDPNMKKVGELARFLSEAFDRELFENLLKKYGLEDQIPYIDHYMDSGWITPSSISPRSHADYSSSFWVYDDSLSARIKRSS